MERRAYRTFRKNLIDEELCGGIHAVGEVQFQMPEFDEMLNYINGVYPCNKKLSKEELKKDLEKLCKS